MSILVDEDTQVLIQGITGKQGQMHTELMLDYNVDVVAGVTPGKGGKDVCGVPVYNTIKQAKKEKAIDATMILVPPPFVLSAALEAVENNISLIVIITEHVPVHDSMKIRKKAKEKNITVIGPNTIGIISPGKSKVGIMPGYIYSEGSIGVISRSGTLTHEISSNLTYKGYGQSTCIGIGGDPIIGLDYVEALKFFRDDPNTEIIVMIGEIGGINEELAADYIENSNYPKPILAFIAGQTAPEGKKMGHAGAIVSKNMGSAKSKINALNKAGVNTFNTLEELIDYIGNNKLLNKENENVQFTR